MKRRTFRALGAAVAWSLVARAGQHVPRIGFLNPVSAVDADKAQIEAFEAGLSELGYAPGKTMEIEFRFADGREERAAELARELVGLRLS
jgi:putative ABC transport system substrate-binding protein